MKHLTGKLYHYILTYQCLTSIWISIWVTFLNNVYSRNKFESDSLTDLSIFTPTQKTKLLTNDRFASDWSPICHYNSFCFHQQSLEPNISN